MVSAVQLFRRLEDLALALTLGRGWSLLIAKMAEILRQPRRDHLASVLQLQLKCDRAPPRSVALSRLSELGVSCHESFVRVGVIQEHGLEDLKSRYLVHRIIEKSE